MLELRTRMLFGSPPRPGLRGGCNRDGNAKARAGQRWSSSAVLSGDYEFSVPTHRPQSSSFLGLPYRILNMNPKKEVLWGLWVNIFRVWVLGFGLCGSGFTVRALGFQLLGSGVQRVRFGIQGFGFRVRSWVSWGFGFGISTWFRVQGWQVQSSRYRGWNQVFESSHS